jgi:hypothetical protein
MTTRLAISLPVRPRRHYSCDVNLSVYHTFPVMPPLLEAERVCEVEYYSLSIWLIGHIFITSCTHVNELHIETPKYLINKDISLYLAL